MSHPSKANFRDPIGLLFRMLKSGNRAAYSALFREGLGLAARPFDAILSLMERPKPRTDDEVERPLLFVVGAPRSGTTLVYQALAKYLDVTYPSNLNGLFPKAPLLAARLQRCLPAFRNSEFQNFYGQTTHLSGPNDAFHIWNRWLGEDRYRTPATLRDQVVAEMRTFFETWTSVFDKPFLNKNNRNTTCVKLLAESLPQARFVVVRRDPLFVAQSLIKARQQVQGDKSVGWGLRSTSTNSDQDPLAYVDDVCRQVSGIDRDINQQLKSIDGGRVYQTTYERFCRYPGESICDIALQFDGVELCPNAAFHQLTAFETSQKRTLSLTEWSRLEQNLSLPKSPAVDGHRRKMLQYG